MRAPMGPRALAAALVVLSAAPAFAADDVQKLLKTLARDKNADDRERAAERLGDLKAVEAVPGLAAALKDKDSRVRAQAAGALLDIGEPARPATPALQEALLDSDGTTVWNAAAALHNMGMVTTDLLPAYRRLLKDRDCDMRVSAAKAIVEYEKPEILLPIALGCQEDEDFTVAREAKELRTAIAKSRDAVPVLIESLADDSPEVREWAARALGDHKPAVAKQAIPALEAVLEDDNEAVRHAANRALFKIRGH
jgi:HEAT repeat protein